MPVDIQHNDYYSLHGIWGAFASLALGRVGKGAGLVVGNVQPPKQGLFAGYRRGSEIPQLLPFSPGIKMGIGEESYHAVDLPARPETPKPTCAWFGEEEIRRSVSFSGETWQAGAITFRVASFFGEIPDPATADTSLVRSRIRPAILLEITFDNTDGTEEMTGFFGLQGIQRPLSDSTHGSLAGFANGNEWGFATLADTDVSEVMDWSILNTGLGRELPMRRLASEGAIRWPVGIGEKRTCVVALGAYRDGVLTSGVRAHAYYTIHFKDLEEVLESALDEADDLFARAASLDAILDSARISDERKFLIAHSAHSYLASTEFLLAESGEPLFIVNEGEYRMMNTLDLTVDQAFWELKWSPWTLKNELDFFLERSSYEDSLGIAFAHDQGLADCFTPSGTSVYELPRLSDCFSYMSYEETLNWVLSACLYSRATGDTAWTAGKAKAFGDCLSSLLARDRNDDGVMDVDSDRCEGGAEITTYDSLDVSLGQARNNLYLAVKAWAAFVCLDALFVRLSGPRSPEAERARHAARLASETIRSRVIPGEDYIPAVFESDNRSRIIPAIEGLIYPLFCGAEDAVKDSGPYGDFVRVLKRHLDAVLVPGVCLDRVSGGWKLSSTSKNTWLSKIFVNQFVAENILGMSGERTERDSVHVSWLQNGSADWGATDQVDSSNGRDLGSRLYPRLVTSILWLFPPR